MHHAREMLRQVEQLRADLQGLSACQFDWHVERAGAARPGARPRSFVQLCPALIATLRGHFQKPPA